MKNDPKMTPNWLHNYYVLFYVTFLTFDDYIKMSRVSLKQSIVPLKIVVNCKYAK